MQQLILLEGCVVTKNLIVSKCLDDDFTRLWHLRLGYIGLDSF